MAGRCCVRTPTLKDETMRLIAHAAHLANPALRTDRLHAPTETRPPLPRARVLEHIMRINRGATVEFLDGFSDPELRDYLDHLDHSYQPEEGSAEAMSVVTRPVRGWVRKGDTAALNAMPSDW